MLHKTQSLACLSCSHAYTANNLPYRLVNCQHFICKRCVVSETQCPSCGAEVGLDDHQLGDFTVVGLSEYRSEVKREALRGSAQKDMRVQEARQGEPSLDENRSFMIEECLLHSKPADLICLDDSAVICSSCALFGKHKGHEVINRQGILMRLSNYLEECLKVLDRVEQANSFFSSTSCQAQVSAILNESKQKNTRIINQKYESLQTTLKIMQKKELLKLNQLYKQKQKNYEQSIVNLQQIEADIQSWRCEIEKIGGLISNTADLERVAECVPYISGQSRLGLQVIEHGQELSDRLSQIQGKIEAELGQEKQANYIHIDEEKIKYVEQICFVKRNSRAKNVQSILMSEERYCKSPLSLKDQDSLSGHKSTKDAQTPVYDQKMSSFNERLKTMSYTDDNLLLSVEPKLAVNLPRQYPILPHVHMVAEELDPENLPFLAISEIKPLQGHSHSESSDSRVQDRLRDIGNAGIILQANGDANKKKKKVEFPEKFRGIVDDLRNDRAETIDLTGAEVGDASILGLCPFLRKSKKLKTLKLIKNKLTDDCLQDLLQALSETKVSSLNLSQNLLTDKACLLISACQVGPHLKTITLTLNKINRRNVKTKTDELAKRSINVLL